MVAALLVSFKISFKEIGKEEQLEDKKDDE
jgi:hypothetical protein